MSKLTAEKLAELRKMCEDAENPTWHVYEDTSPNGLYVHGVCHQDDKVGAIFEDRWASTSDLELIVAAVNALPALLDAIERVRELHTLCDPTFWNGGKFCVCCSNEWPCQTIKAVGCFEKRQK